MENNNYNDNQIVHNQNILIIFVVFLHKLIKIMQIILNVFS
jgi:hypothetical protein